MAQVHPLGKSPVITDGDSDRGVRRDRGLLIRRFGKGA